MTETPAVYETGRPVDHAVDTLETFLLEAVRIWERVNPGRVVRRVEIQRRPAVDRSEIAAVVVSIE